jgi:hypothetical protein
MTDFYNIYYGGDYDQSLDEMPNEKLEELQENYSNLIDKYKYNLYSKIVAKDTESEDDSKDPIYEYHSLYLHSIAFWISLLDHRSIPEPNLDQDLKTEFDTITATTQDIINSGTDTRVIAYNILNKKSVERPEFFNKQQQDELGEGVPARV